ncbi:uncharacterized protein LOC134183684 [Corticium candelabrum]|uniref:uncharacterized protein LOC134183684 n=1 Tax=Corticium candelabrum TaxID=121492 RepID=UPI002E2710CC|nr:uncharacterized protein LOC134183684 [Corticium candelabrum]XP_062507255.1 uncharacterized protein LOC134183684 [Corticium candelabrum]
MSSVAENDKEPIILTGPNADALQDFENTLAHVAPEISSQHRELRKLIGKQLIEEHLDFSHVKCFLVMPRASRTLVYLEGDRSSMYQELKLMCATKNDEWNNITRVIIVLHRNEEVAQSDALYDCQKINLWWDPGPQRELQQFTNINHLISFRSKLNIEQTNVIRKFLGYKPKQQEKKQKQRNNKVGTKSLWPFCLCISMMLIWPSHAPDAYMTSNVFQLLCS